MAEKIAARDAPGLDYSPRSDSSRRSMAIAPRAATGIKQAVAWMNTDEKIVSAPGFFGVFPRRPAVCPVEAMLFPSMTAGMVGEAGTEPAAVAAVAVVAVERRWWSGGGAAAVAAVARRS